MQLIDNTLEYLRDKRFLGTLRTWLTSFTILIVFCILELTLTPVIRPFNGLDPRISHPFSQETVSSFACFVLTIVIPLLVIGIKERFDLHRANTIGLSFVLSMSFNLILIEVVKNLIGKPRPDFMSRCGPIDDAKSPIIDVTACTLPPYGQWSLIDGLRAFPSGHLSASFGGLGFFALYLRHITKRNSMVLFPLIIACLIAFSRLKDYRHDIYDVSVGGLIGLLIGVWGWNHVDIESLGKPVLPV